MADRVDINSYVVDIPDYPQPGVVFKDITPIFSHSEAFMQVVDDIAAHFEGRGITKVVSPEARGFMLGAPVACRLGAGFVPARKPGKLPRETVSVSYDLEYGTDSIEIHTDALEAGDRILVIDDLAATGGTARAVAQLAEKEGATVAGYGFILELAFLNPRDTLVGSGDIDMFSLIVSE